MEVLRDLGFTAEEAVAALKQCDQNVEVAANLLFTLSSFERDALVKQMQAGPTAVHQSAGFMQQNILANDGPYKMVLCVRKDLGMSAGKQCAQCCHAAVALTQMSEPGDFIRWRRRWELESGSAKIVLGVDDEEHLLRLTEHAAALKLPFHVVQDAGRTEVEAGTRTVLGIGPAPSSSIDQITRTLPLL